ncbi:MAG: IS91 family transposase, partial [Betaproteobacteria bacterium]|nr:IS91 family transposase [Betaproteobacteria bacterium]
MAEVLRRHGPAFLAAHPLSGAKAKVWRAILACRTAALGGHVQTCDACGATRHVYHS